VRKRIYTVSLVPKKDREVAYFSYQKCTVTESVVCYLTSQFHLFFLDLTFPCVANLVLCLERQDLDLEVRGSSLGSGLFHQRRCWYVPVVRGRYREPYHSITLSWRSLQNSLD
jgi:hypothetical protein